MTIRLLAVLSAVLCVACGAAETPDAGALEGCSTKPFGAFAGTFCDGGGIGSFAFGSDGGVSWAQVATYSCTTDWNACAALMTCQYDATSSYVFDLQWAPSMNTLSGTMRYQGQTSCVSIAK